MATIAPDLLKKLQALPTERLSEVEDFVEFLNSREQRERARRNMRETLSRIHSLNIDISAEEIAEEIRQVRLQKAKS